MSRERAIPIIAETEFRSTGNTHTFTGYAALFDTASEPFAGDVIETVGPSAFTRTLAAPTRKTFVIDHDDMRLLASTTGASPLRLSADSRGLLNEAELPDTSYVRDLRELHDRRELSGMSFEFSKTPSGVKFSSDGKRRQLTDVRLHHTTVLVGLTPRYAGTFGEIRALADAIGAEPEDIDTVLDAVREQRRLDDGEWALMDRILAAVRPEQTEVRADIPVLTPTLDAARALLAR